MTQKNYDAIIGKAEDRGYNVVNTTSDNEAITGFDTWAEASEFAEANGLEVVQLCKDGRKWRVEKSERQLTCDGIDVIDLIADDDRVEYYTKDEVERLLDEARLRIEQMTRSLDVFDLSEVKDYCDNMQELHDEHCCMGNDELLVYDEDSKDYEVYPKVAMEMHFAMTAIDDIPERVIAVMYDGDLEQDDDECAE